MAQRLKTDRILFITVVLMVLFGVADGVQRVERGGGKPHGFQLLLCDPATGVGSARRFR